MQQANQILNHVAKSNESMRSSGAGPGNAKTYLVDGMRLTIPEILWRRMTGLYAYKWTRAYGESPTPEWEMALAGLTPESIRQGLARMVDDSRFSAWPPNPIEFRGLCMPKAEDLGLPGDEQAFRQAVGLSSGKHPAVVFTLREMGDVAFELRRLPADKSRRLFQEHWNQTLAHVSAGGGLPESEQQIEQQRTKADPETAQEHLGQIMEILA